MICAIEVLYFSLSRLRERARVRAVSLEHWTLTSILSRRERKKKRRI